MSPGLTAMNDLAAAAGPFAGAARLLEELAGVRLAAKRVERAAEASGTALAAAGRGRAVLIAARKLVPLPPSPLPDKLYAAIDGTGVPMTAKETAGREGKSEDGRARTREAKLAVFFTQDKLDKDGYPVRDRASTSVIATFEPAGVFAGLVKAEGIRRGADHVRQLTILGDGAAWIWNIAAAKFPEATQIVDLFHAREHLHDLAGVLEFILGDHKQDWLAARLEDLDYGDIDTDHVRSVLAEALVAEALYMEDADTWLQRPRHPDFDVESPKTGRRVDAQLDSVGNLGIWLTAVTPGASLAGT
jgi:hypothetical protein